MESGLARSGWEDGVSSGSENGGWWCAVLRAGGGEVGALQRMRNRSFFRGNSGGWGRRGLEEKEGVGVGVGGIWKDGMDET